MTPFYDKNGITLYCGNALTGLASLKAASVAAVLTDPPYGTDVPRDGYGRRQLGARHIAGDSDLGLAVATLKVLPRLLKNDAWVILFCSPKKRHESESAYRSAGLSVYGEVVWDKASPGLGGGIRYQHETVLLGSFGKPAGKASLFSVHREWVGDTCGRKPHPHQKPDGLLRRLVGYATSPGDLVLDPFFGSGTTARACLESGRRFVGWELSEEYCAVAARLLDGTTPGLFVPRVPTVAAPAPLLFD